MLAAWSRAWYWELAIIHVHWFIIRTCIRKRFSHTPRECRTVRLIPSTANTICLWYWGKLVTSRNSRKHQRYSSWDTRIWSLKQNVVHVAAWNVSWRKIYIFGVQHFNHDDVIKWKHFPRYWPFVRAIHRSLWIPRTKASDAELWCFLWSAPE